jgi:hypothetical protein
VEHYTRWLQKDISGIIADAEGETITSCSRQPEVSLAREEMKTYLNRTSAGMRLDRESHFRSFVLGPVNVDFDSCISELKHHKGSVRFVAYNFDSRLLASASDDNTVAVWNTKTGMVEFVPHRWSDVCCMVDRRPDAGYSSRDNTVRIYGT